MIQIAPNGWTHRVPDGETNHRLDSFCPCGVRFVYEPDLHHGPSSADLRAGTAYVEHHPMPQIELHMIGRGPVDRSSG